MEIRIDSVIHIAADCGRSTGDHIANHCFNTVTVVIDDACIINSQCAVFNIDAGQTVLGYRCAESKPCSAARTDLETVFLIPNQVDSCQAYAVTPSDYDAVIRTSDSQVEQPDIARLKYSDVADYCGVTTDSDGVFPDLNPLYTGTRNRNLKPITRCGGRRIKLFLDRLTFVTIHKTLYCTCWCRNQRNTEKGDGCHSHYLHVH